MKKQCGLTLVELMLTLMVLSVMVVIVTGTVSMSKVMLYQKVDKSQVDNKANRIMNLIMREVREAKQGKGTCTTSCSDIEWNNPNNICAGIFCLNGGVIYSLSFKTPEQRSQNQTAYKTVRYDLNYTTKKISRREISSVGAVTGPTVIASNIEGIVTPVEGTWSDPAIMIQVTALDSSDPELSKTLYNEISFRNR